jgi:hypothetical protein
VKHELKCWPEPFAAVREGVKTHEIREAIDRSYSVGDVLEMREWVPSLTLLDGRYTGRRVSVKVTHITRGGQWGIPEGLCVMSIRRLTSRAARSEGVGA